MTETTISPYPMTAGGATPPTFEEDKPMKKQRNDSPNRTCEREPRWARTSWFARNYGLSRYMLLQLAETDGVGCVKTDEGRTGILLFNVKDVKSAIGRMARKRAEKTRICRAADGPEVTTTTTTRSKEQ